MIRHFEEELNLLKQRLLAMGNLVEGMINSAIRAVLEQKADLKKDAIEREEEVNKSQIDIDDSCITMIALQQPAAADLRFITSAMKINSDLERMGDQAVNIAQHSLEAAEVVTAEVKELTSRMSEKVKKMVRDSLDSFVKRDLRMAQDVLESDDEVDAAKDEIYLKLTDFMKNDPDTINRSLDFILISRNLERIGDHATNIAEDVIYMVAGKDIRHHILEERA
jgi:phosphate transport system protein